MNKIKNYYWMSEQSKVVEELISFVCEIIVCEKNILYIEC